MVFVSMVNIKTRNYRFDDLIGANFFKGAPSRKKGAKKGAFFRKKGQKRGKKKGLPYIQTSIYYFILIVYPFTSALHLFVKNVPYLPC